MLVGEQLAAEPPLLLSTQQLGQNVCLCGESCRWVTMEAEVQCLQFGLSFLWTVQWLPVAQLSTSRAVWW